MLSFLFIIFAFYGLDIKAMENNQVAQRNQGETCYEYISGYITNNAVPLAVAQASNYVVQKSADFVHAYFSLGMPPHVIIDNSVEYKTGLFFAQKIIENSSVSCCAATCAACAGLVTCACCSFYSYQKYNDEFSHGITNSYTMNYNKPHDD